MRQALRHEFVEFIPAVLEEGVVYVSTTYATAAHRCCCGCGHEVVTPLTPTDWTLSFDGATVSFNPSIGNWSFPCRSHYWIERNRVIPAPSWSTSQIEAGRDRDRWAKGLHYGKRSGGKSDTEGGAANLPWWRWLRRVLSGNRTKPAD
jgi:hypothetical protein